MGGLSGSEPEEYDKEELDECDDVEEAAPAAKTIFPDLLSMVKCMELVCGSEAGRGKALAEPCEFLDST